MENAIKVTRPPECFAADELGFVVIDTGRLRLALPLKYVGDLLIDLGWAAGEAKLALPACEAVIGPDEPSGSGAEQTRG